MGPAAFGGVLEHGWIPFIQQIHRLVNDLFPLLRYALKRHVDETDGLASVDLREQRCFLVIQTDVKYLHRNVLRPHIPMPLLSHHQPGRNTVLSIQYFTLIGLRVVGAGDHSGETGVHFIAGLGGGDLARTLLPQRPVLLPDGHRR